MSANEIKISRTGKVPVLEYSTRIDQRGSIIVPKEFREKGFQKGTLVRVVLKLQLTVEETETKFTLEDR